MDNLEKALVNNLCPEVAVLDLVIRELDLNQQLRSEPLRLDLQPQNGQKKSETLVTVLYGRFLICQSLELRGHEEV